MSNVTVFAVWILLVGGQLSQVSDRLPTMSPPQAVLGEGFVRQHLLVLMVIGRLIC